MSMMMGTGMDKTLPGLDGFTMIGQGVEPGGNAELSAASGREVNLPQDQLDGRDRSGRERPSEGSAQILARR
mgnify:CR=1 FL=1